jgi:hypothetical protein
MHNRSMRSDTPCPIHTTRTYHGICWGEANEHRRDDSANGKKQAHLGTSLIVRVDIKAGRI